MYIYLTLLIFGFFFTFEPKATISTLNNIQSKITTYNVNFSNHPYNIQNKRDLEYVLYLSKINFSTITKDTNTL